MSTILITGGAGYIGNHLTKYFLDLGYRVVVFDNLSAGFLQPIDELKKIGDLTFVRGDLRNRQQLESAFNLGPIDAVVHLAALCSVDQSMKEPGLYFVNNVFGSLNLLGTMRVFGVNKIIFASTCGVYQLSNDLLSFNESTPLKPSNPYSQSKLMAEQQLYWYGKIHKFRYVILRFFNACGASFDGSLGDSKKPSVLLMANAVRGAMGLADFTYTYSAVATPDGSPIRDFIDVNDISRAIELSLEYLAQGGVNEIFNIGRGQGFSVKQVVAAVEEVFDRKFSPKKGLERQGELPMAVADYSRARSVLGWEPKISLLESIKNLKKWYEHRPHGWQY